MVSNYGFAARQEKKKTGCLFFCFFAFFLHLAGIIDNDASGSPSTPVRRPSSWIGIRLENYSWG
jgi:hypothetical protein